MPFKNGSDAQDINVEDLRLARAREAIRSGRPQEVVFLLGHPWIVQGPVQHGDARGRTIGFPTANLHLDGTEPAAFGIYAVRVEIAGDDGEAPSRHEGVASFGQRPMFQTERPLFEAHLFDFSGDIYGRTLRIALISWLRAEQKFDGIEALVAQIRADVVAAKDALRSLERRKVF